MLRTLASRGVVIVLFFRFLFSGSAYAIPDPEFIKWNVVRVWPEYHKKIRSAFAEFSDRFRSVAEELQRNHGSTTAIEILTQLSTYYKEQSTSPWHGSGWIFVPKGSPTALVITNKHVAGSADSVLFEFEGQRYTSISKTRVIYTDPNYDIAIIEVPKKLLPPQSTGFQLAHERPIETSQVWSAGFPSYGDNDTIFALTSGHVSSTLVSDNDGAKYIAHTATTNPGNSGGPLLVEVGPIDSSGFRVTGMNTARIIGSTNVNLAIPAEIIGNAIEAARQAQNVSRNKEKLRAALRSSARRLADELGSSRPNAAVLSSLVSYTFVSEHPEVMAVDLLKLVQGKMTKDEQDRFGEFPVDYSRETLLNIFRETFATGTSNVDTVKLERITDEDRVSATTQARSIYTVAGKRQEIFWIWEHGAWRIADASFDQALRDKQTEIAGKFRAQGLNISLSGSTSASRTKTPQQSGQAGGAKASSSAIAAAARVQLAARIGLGSRGASSDNFQSNLSSDSAVGFDVALAFPVNKYFWIKTGLGYEPLGVSYPVSVSGMSITIMEKVNYLQIPALLHLELPLGGLINASLRTRFFASAGVGLDLAATKRGTFGDGTVSAELSSIDWYDGFRSVNVAGVGSVGVEFGFGPSPISIGLDLTVRMHLLEERSGDFFTDGANYRYMSTQFGLFVKYQMAR